MGDLARSDRENKEPSSFPSWNVISLFLLYILSHLPFLLFPGGNLSQLTETKVGLLPFILILGFNGVFYLYLVVRIYFRREKGISMLTMLLFSGVVIRLILFFGPVLYEDDFYRYRWDGAVVASGLNPYRYSPEEIKNADEDSSIPSSYRILGSRSEEILEQINFPELRTVYPPLLEGIFGLASWLSPNGNIGLKCIYLVADVLSLFLIFMLLGSLSFSRVMVGVYWLNPLFIVVTYGSLHMEVLLFPLLLASFYLAFQNRYLLSLICIVGAAGIKVWPLVLLPFIFLYWEMDWKRNLIYFGGVLLFLFMLFWPMLNAQWTTDAGWVAYGFRWRNNSSVYYLVLTFFKTIFGEKSVYFEGPRFAARIAVLGLFGLIWTGAGIWFYQISKRRDTELLSAGLWTVFGVFMLSPTQFPWYYFWLFPFLVFRPRVSLLCLTPLLVVYYIQYLPGVQKEQFETVYVWLQWIPLFLLLLVERYQKNSYLTLEKT